MNPIFPFPTPTNAAQATRQIAVAARAESMLPALYVGGEYDTYNCGNGTYGMMKRSYSNAPDTTYTLRLDPVPFCSCPDFEKHGDFCKHLVALWKVEYAAYEAAQVEKLEAEYQNYEDAENFVY